MTDVKMPDGTVVRFPDDMPREEVKRMILSKFPDAAPRQALPEIFPGQNAIRTFQDNVTQGATFGFADEISAGIAAPFRAGADAVQGKGFDLGRAYSEGVEDIRGYDAELNEAHPVAATAGNIAGAVGGGVGLAKGGLTLMNAAKPTISSMATRGGIEGAIYGLLHGAGQGEGAEDKVNSAATGALWGGGAGGLMGAAAGAVANRAAVNAAPSVDDLRAQASSMYDAAKNSGVVFPQAAVKSAADDIAAKAMSEGLDETLHPGATAALRRLRTAAKTGMTAQDAQTLRRVIAGAAKSPTNPDQSRIAMEMVRLFDDQITGSIPQLSSANAIYGRARRGQLIEDAFMKAKDKLGVNYNNAGMVTALRQEFNRILQNPKTIRGFSEPEVKAIREFVRGGAAENFLRRVGKLAPTGPISGATAFGVPAMLGYTLGNPVAGAAAGIGAAGTGVAARGAGNAIAMNQAQRIAAMIRNGAPLGQAAVSGPGLHAAPALQALIAGGGAEAPRIPEHSQAALRALISGTSP